MEFIDRASDSIAKHSAATAATEALKPDVARVPDKSTVYVEAAAQAAENLSVTIPATPEATDSDAAVPGVPESASSASSMSFEFVARAEVDGDSEDADKPVEAPAVDAAQVNAAVADQTPVASNTDFTDSAEDETGGYLDEDGDDAANEGDADDEEDVLDTDAEIEVVDQIPDESPVNEDYEEEDQLSPEQEGLRRRHIDLSDAAMDEAQPTITVTDPNNVTLKDLGLPEPTNLFEEVWMSIFTPGINSKVVFVMDLCFYALFLSLFGLLVVSGGNFHVVFLLLIATCLFVSVKWFIAESKKVAAENAALAESAALTKDETSTTENPPQPTSESNQITKHSHPKIEPNSVPLSEQESKKDQ
ncbi:hypothetical protein BCR33DRAFT_713519 [Rhizoclosmatium globosum]|uniref:Pkr1-domain-containing protein n=1 Tax=Rhizoclosmatium globosum TaxID=329046 RepID=A0A1Y2CS95_9FUNG|nr:hypothetical protein BCR33DRAFT_713519 [Rhizoclosmatium globosum]|eukprot:ORY49919.1 hypothetical protein BCR33DRAFT_713519 [Rhizoclosmatium globosum]